MNGCGFGGQSRIAISNCGSASSGRSRKHSTKPRFAWAAAWLGLSVTACCRCCAASGANAVVLAHGAQCEVGGRVTRCNRHGPAAQRPPPAAAPPAPTSCSPDQTCGDARRQAGRSRTRSGWLAAPPRPAHAPAAAAPAAGPPRCEPTRRPASLTGRPQRIRASPSAARYRYRRRSATPSHPPIGPAQAALQHIPHTQLLATRRRSNAPPLARANTELRERSSDSLSDAIGEVASLPPPPGTAAPRSPAARRTPTHTGPAARSRRRCPRARAAAGLVVALVTLASMLPYTALLFGTTPPDVQAQGGNTSAYIGMRSRRVWRCIPGCGGGSPTTTPADPTPRWLDARPRGRILGLARRQPVPPIAATSQLGLLTKFRSRASLRRQRFCRASSVSRA